MVFLGTRPEIIKMQPIMKQIEKGSKHELVFIHTGQHYDWNMSGIFIEELGLRKPNCFLNIGSSSRGLQISKILGRSESIIKREEPDIVLVQGDTNSALGGALSASSLDIPVGHVEAGCRSFDKRMPEESNRVMIADIASLHFAPTENTVRNLLREGINEQSVYLTGHPLVDLLESISDKINEKPLKQFGLNPKKYYILTLHRQENINSRDRLQSILEGVSVLATKKAIIFPIHPHTKKRIKQYKLGHYLDRICLVSPQSYVTMLSLIKYASLVLTDSGGIQQEAALLRTFCITLRENTEWVETIMKNVNFLAGYNPEKIIEAAGLAEKTSAEFAYMPNIGDMFGQVGVSKRILSIIEARK